MSYLDPYLVNNPSQVVSCNDLYTYFMRVKKEKNEIDQITRGITDITIGLRIKSIIPDVQEWQYAGESSSHFFYRFHRPGDREQAVTLLRSEGYIVSTRDLRK